MNDDQIKMLVEADQRSKSNTHRIDKLEEQYEILNKLSTSVEVMATKLDAMNTSVQRVASQVSEQAAKPAKRWEAIVEKALLLAVAAVVGYVLTQIGFNM